jgi:hypothetical protein
MWRFAFLFVVVLGALAIVIGLIAGVGVFRAAQLRAANAPASPAAAPASRPAPVPAPLSDANRAASAGNPGAPAATANNAPAPRPPAAGQVAPILLLARDATLQGDDFKLADDGKAIVNWINRGDVLEWVVQIPRSGEYAVDLEYACDPKEGGGGAEVSFGIWPRILIAVRPTASWQDFQTMSTRMLVPEGKFSFILRPYYLIPDRQLMNLRSVKLTLVQEMEVSPMPDRTRRFRIPRGGFDGRGMDGRGFGDFPR